MDFEMDQQFALWLDEHAQALDEGTVQTEMLRKQLASTGLLRVGVPEVVGGNGELFSQVISVAATLAEHSLTAAFVFWAQRVFIEGLLQSPNRSLGRDLLPSLLSGTTAGASGLSNAMKHLGKFEPLRAQFTRQSGRYCLNGTFPWVTNLVPIGFVSALAAGNPENDTAAIFAVPHDAHGVMRSDDLDLIGLRGSHTASLALHNTVLEEDWIIHPQATVFLPHIRPALIGMQCGWALGIAKASLKAACGATEMTRSILNHEAQALNDDLHHYWQQLARGIDKGDFREQPRQLFEIRIVLIELAMRAVQLELQALGGRAYQSSDSAAFQRRWREAAFLPIVTPSLVQIKAQLASRA